MAVATAHLLLRSGELGVAHLRAPCTPHVCLEHLAVLAAWVTIAAHLRTPRAARASLEHQAVLGALVLLRHRLVGLAALVRLGHRLMGLAALVRLGHRLKGLAALVRLDHRLMGLATLVRLSHRLLWLAAWCEPVWSRRPILRSHRLALIRRLWLTALIWLGHRMPWALLVGSCVRCVRCVRCGHATSLSAHRIGSESGSFSAGWGIGLFAGRGCLCGICSGILGSKTYG